MSAEYRYSLELQISEKFLENAKRRPSLYAADPEDLEVVLYWLGVLATAGEVPSPAVVLQAPSASRRWSAFALGWLAEDLLPSGWHAHSRAARIGRTVFRDARVSDSSFATVWTLMLMSGAAQTGQGTEFQDRRIGALRQFGDFCPTPWQREKWIREGTFIRRPFEEAEPSGVGGSADPQRGGGS